MFRESSLTLDVIGSYCKLVRGNIFSFLINTVRKRELKEVPTLSIC